MTKTIKDLPNYLSMQKRAIQSFPDNQKVALYYCDPLKKYFSIAYGKEGYTMNECDYSIIDELKILSEVTEFHFMDGSSLNIDQECATHILNLYEEIDDGQQEFEEYLKDSDKNFLNVLKYSIKRGVS